MGRLAVAAIVSMWVIPVSFLVNSIVPEPYMVRIITCVVNIILNFEYPAIALTQGYVQDEIFHIPQAQRYCRGNFRSWDPMITTPPGL